MTIGDLAARLPSVRWSGDDKLKARCPAHEDREPSLSVARGRNGGLVLRCHAGCEVPAILDALGLTICDLQPDDATRPERRIVAVYPYRDETGRHLYDSVRFDPKDFRLRRADGAWTLDGVRLVLFRLDEIQAKKSVFIVEGEKDADALAALGLPVTTNVMGAGKWREDYTHQLREAGVERVCVLSDNDEPGRAHAKIVAASCHGAGLKVRILLLPGLSGKGDVSDWLAAGGTKDQVRELARACPVWTPTMRAEPPGERAAPPAPRSAFARPKVAFAFGDSVLAPLPDAKYSGWFNRGALHVIGGSSGAGKTTLLLDLLRRQHTGEAFLGHVGRRQDYLVIFADRGEVSNQETFERMGIDRTTFPVVHIHGTPHAATSAAQILAKVEACHEIPAAVFVEGADMLVEEPSKPGVVTEFMAQLLQMAEHYGLAVILSVGAGKMKPKAGYVLKRDQLFGSIMWSRRADTVLVLTIDADGTTPKRHLVVLHRNAAAETFDLEFKDGRLVPAAVTPAATKQDLAVWFRKAKVFTARQFRCAFPRFSGHRAAELLDGFVKLGALRIKRKNNQRYYAYRNGTDLGLSHEKWEDFHAAELPGKTVPPSGGMGHGNVEANDEIPKDLASLPAPPLAPPQARPSSHYALSSNHEWDENACPTLSPRARQEEASHPTTAPPAATGEEADGGAVSSVRVENRYDPRRNLVTPAPYLGHDRPTETWSAFDADSSSATPVAEDDSERY